MASALCLLAFLWWSPALASTWNEGPLYDLSVISAREYDDNQVQLLSAKRQQKYGPTKSNWAEYSRIPNLYLIDCHIFSGSSSRIVHGSRSMWSGFGCLDLDANGTNLFGTFRLRDLAENKTVARSLGIVTWIHDSSYRIPNGFSSR